MKCKDCKSFSENKCGLFVTLGFVDTKPETDCKFDGCREIIQWRSDGLQMKKMTPKKWRHYKNDAGKWEKELIKGEEE